MLIHFARQRAPRVLHFHCFQMLLQCFHYYHLHPQLHQIGSGYLPLPPQPGPGGDRSHERAAERGALETLRGHPSVR
jgi:hypothetical protein